MIGVQVDGDIEKVAAEMSDFPETDYVVITTGSFDILAEVVCDDDESLLELINRRVRALPGVRRTETFMYLTLRKHIYTYGTR
jgi:Lrp/AsnC family transcriptional regulator for asnA, asnC and gidA